VNHWCLVSSFLFKIEVVNSIFYNAHIIANVNSAVVIM
jgi:hypothetical protein